MPQQKNVHQRCRTGDREENTCIHRTRSWVCLEAGEAEMPPAAPVPVFPRSCQRKHDELTQGSLLKRLLLEQDAAAKRASTLTQGSLLKRLLLEQDAATNVYQR